MEVIYKYELKGAQTILELPQDFSVLSAQIQNDKLYLWIRVDLDNSSEKKRFWVFGTGHEFPMESDDMTYHGTVQHGQYVWHVWEEDQPIED